VLPIGGEVRQYFVSLNLTQMMNLDVAHTLTAASSLRQDNIAGLAVLAILPDKLITGWAL
jgi:hypothetical protein